VERLLSLHPANRWVLLTQGYLLQQRGREVESSTCFERILELPNQEPDFLGRLFKAWSWMALAQAHDGDPVEARRYLEEIVNSGIGGEMLTDATRMLRDLEDTSRHAEMTPNSAMHPTGACGTRR
jgi:Flp pilus assembly protein TadD